MSEAASYARRESAYIKGVWPAEFLSQSNSLRQEMGEDDPLSGSRRAGEARSICKIVCAFRRLSCSVKDTGEKRYGVVLLVTLVDADWSVVVFCNGGGFVEDQNGVELSAD